MVQRKKQRGFSLAERRLIVRVILLLFLVGALWIIFAPGWGILHYRKVHNQVETLLRENEALTERNAKLRREIERLQQNDAYLEELARKKYGMLKENETVYEYGSSGKKK